MMIHKRRIVASEEVGAPEIQDVEVQPEASDLLFEAEDVAELVAEVSGQPVDVDVDEDSVTFTVGDDEYVVEPEGDEEILECVRKNLRGKRAVSATTQTSKPAGKVIRKLPKRR